VLSAPFPLAFPTHVPPLPFPMRTCTPSARHFITRRHTRHAPHAPHPVHTFRRGPHGGLRSATCSCRLPVTAMLARGACRFVVGQSHPWAGSNHSVKAGPTCWMGAVGKFGRCVLDVQECSARGATLSALAAVVLSACATPRALRSRDTLPCAPGMLAVTKWVVCADPCRCEEHQRGSEYHPHAREGSAEPRD